MSNQLDQMELKGIFISDFPQAIDRETIQTLFQQYGKIVTITTKAKSQYCSAVVQFSTHEEAQNALRDANYTKIDGKPIHITWERSSKISYPQEGNIVISHLPLDVEESQLHTLLEKYGEVYSVAILRNKDGTSRGQGYVQFTTAEAAKQAIEELQGASLEGYTLTVERFLPPDQRTDIPQSLPPNAVGLEPLEGQSLPAKPELEKLMNQYGHVVELLILDKAAVVFYEKHEDVRRACAEFKSTTLAVKTHMKKDVTTKVFQRDESRRMFVSDLTCDDQEAIKKHLSQAGKIVTLEIHSQKNTFAFAQYENAEIRNKAIAQLNRTMFPGQTLPICAIPQIDKRLHHENAGLLVLNELAANTRFAAFQQMVSKYGKVLACTLAPTQSHSMMGFALYEKEADAKSALAGIASPNAWIVPKTEASELLQLFVESFSTYAVVVYGAPSNTTEYSADQEYIKYGSSLQGVSVGKDGDKKVIYVFYTKKSDAISVYNKLLASGTECDVFSTGILIRYSYLISSLAIPMDILSRFVFVSGFSGVNNEQLRAIMERAGKVQMVSINYNGNDGSSRQQALVLFEKEESAFSAIQDPLFAYEFPTFKVIPFKNKETHPRRSPVTPLPFAPQQGVQKLSRDDVRKAIQAAEAPEEKKQEALEKVKKLSINEAHFITQNQDSINEWVKAVLA